MSDGSTAHAGIIDRSRSSCPEGWMPAGYAVPDSSDLKAAALLPAAPSASHASSTTSALPPTASAARTECPGPPGRTSTRPSTRPSARTTHSSTEIASPRPGGRLHGLRGRPARTGVTPGHSAGPPQVQKEERRAGAGSLRAASGVAQLRYDGKHRIRLPVMGSVKLVQHTACGHSLRGAYQPSERPAGS